jgi:hypothetical protein
MYHYGKSHNSFPLVSQHSCSLLSHQIKQSTILLVAKAYCKVSLLSAGTGLGHRSTQRSQLKTAQPDDIMPLAFDIFFKPKAWQ